MQHNIKSGCKLQLRHERHNATAQYITADNDTTEQSRITYGMRYSPQKNTVMRF